MGNRTILDELADFARYRTSEAKKKKSYEEIRRESENLPKGLFEFENALAAPGISFICECKKASPSKGIIAQEFPYLDIAKEYEEAGADCISVLTEPKWFLGSNKYLEEIAGAVKTPCIRKDFTVDEYMIHEAKVLGAKAVLLICSILEKSQIKEYIEICDELGISALVEAHDEKEIETALEVSSRIIGVNNRNLKDFAVDTNNSKRLRSIVPKDVLFVSESGVSSVDDIRNIKEFGADAVLIGEYLMRSTDKKALLDQMKSV
ncbi:indole-3-glycerol phosphate synthase TrpC [Butyrivibrio sp. VCB2006]|uniref:indole-3-glycerol phosphate synthase TrpC n=1 Tax=Butyrivibrio sp. VCB2006 TaxID=1280679 RepID=UPI0004046260|nr:indole-3-glycerol phosphate synthase TrpC [Butyrivibrio sp. VCB2006]